jgi:hypothetical protein
MIENLDEVFVTAFRSSIAKVYGDFLRLESVWNSYGLRIDSKIVGIQSLTRFHEERAGRVEGV